MESKNIKSSTMYIFGNANFPSFYLGVNNKDGETGVISSLEFHPDLGYYDINGNLLVEFLDTKSCFSGSDLDMAIACSTPYGVINPYSMGDLDEISKHYLSRYENQNSNYCGKKRKKLLGVLNDGKPFRVLLSQEVLNTYKLN